MTNDITILSCPICNNPKLREYGNGIYQCDVCETYFDKDENIVLTEQEWLQTADTEQLAEWIFQIFGEGVAFGETHGKTKLFPNDDIIHEGLVVEWLKQPHREE